MLPVSSMKTGSVRTCLCSHTEVEVAEEAPAGSVFSKIPCLAATVGICTCVQSGAHSCDPALGTPGTVGAKGD